MKRILGVLTIVVLALASAPQAATQLGSRWTEFHAPAVSVQATITHAAVVGKKHIAQCVMAVLAAGAAAPAAATVNVVLRDGAAGVGAIRWQHQLSITAVAGEVAPPLQLCGLSIPGTTGNAMTLEFSAGAGANTFETIYLQGWTE